MLPAGGAAARLRRCWLATEKKLAAVERRPASDKLRHAAHLSPASSVESAQPSASEDRRERHASILRNDAPCKQISNRNANRVFIDARSCERFGERAILGRGARCQPADCIQSVRSQ
jgi:hypothetical protein